MLCLLVCLTGWVGRGLFIRFVYRDFGSTVGVWFWGLVSIEMAAARWLFLVEEVAFLMAPFRESVCFVRVGRYVGPGLRWAGRAWRSRFAW